MRSLKEIAKYVGADPSQTRLEPGTSTGVQDLECDSRQIKSGCAFVALKGTRVSGWDYILDAQQRGACAVITPSENQQALEQTPGLMQQLKIPVIYMRPDFPLARLACWFYNHPSRHLSLIGVTGTNGKSTVAEITAQWLNALGRRCAVMGTLGWGFLPDLVPVPNTTLEPLKLQQSLAALKYRGALYASIEVSSIGAAQGRVDGCRFVAGGFTNLTRDHLDYHGTMEAYAEAKERFLSMVYDSGQLCLNGDDDYGRELASKYSETLIYSRSPEFFRSFGHFSSTSWLWIRHVDYRPDGLKLQVESSFGKGECELGFLGSFNVENFACALGMLLSLGFSLDELLRYAPSLKPVPGRMETFFTPGKTQIVVDYAHTPDGVEQALRAVKAHHPGGKVWCVLGCGGDRDKGKRAIMAIKASVYADRAVFTSDNPRSEDPAAILNDMAAGVGDASNAVYIEDRGKAIKYAWEHASADDVVVIAGKGHEDYQIFADRTVHFSDREVAGELTGDRHD